MKRVINFSGGKTSALMTILLKPTENDIVLFTDTGREHPLTYKFIDDFEKYEGIKVTRISYKGKFDAFVRKAKFLPNQQMRICTTELKIKTLGNPVLRKKSRPVSRITDRHRNILSDMAGIMYDTSGVGLRYHT